MKKVTKAELTQIRTTLLAQQGHKCALCGVSFKERTVKNGKPVMKYRPCVDHCHTNGHIRAILCNNCNGKEGKVMKLATACQRAGTPLDWLVKLVDYLTLHQKAQTPYIHPEHKSEDEKRLLRNKKARLKRAQAKAKQLVG